MTNIKLQQANDLNEAITFIDYIISLYTKDTFFTLNTLDSNDKSIIPNILRDDLLIFLKEKQIKYKKQLSDL